MKEQKALQELSKEFNDTIMKLFLQICEATGVIKFTGFLSKLLKKL